jgi:protein-disulfide isomerase
MSKRRSRMADIVPEADDAKAEQATEQAVETQVSEQVSEQASEEKPVVAEKPKTGEKPAAKDHKKPVSGIKVTKSHAIYVGIAVIFFAVGFYASMGMNPTGAITAQPGVSDTSDQLVMIRPTGCTSCDALEPVTKEVAASLGIPFKTTGFDRQMATPGYMLVYNGKYMTTAGFDSAATLKDQICQLTNVKAICDQVPKDNSTQEPATPMTAKSDKPVANGFIMSYCPYGLQFLKAYVPVMELLGSKADLKVDFVPYTMHGEKEMVENNNMYCIQKEQQPLFTKYLRCMVEKQDSAACVAEIKVDNTKLKACLAKLETDYNVTGIFKAGGSQYPPYPVDAALATQYGVRGSPTFVLNGQTVSVNRSPEAIKQAVCAAFNTPPAECQQTLSTAAESPGAGPVGQGGGTTGTTAGCG